MYAVKCVGNTNPCGHGQGGNVYSTQGLAPALTVAKSTPLQVCMSIKGQKLQKQIDVSQTLDSSCRNNLLQKQTCCAVLTPDREEKRQNGRRIKEPGEPSFTLTAQDRHGVAILRKERNEYGKSIRKDYEAGKVAESRHNMTQYACREDGISNTLSTVQKDNLLMCAYDEQNNNIRTDGTVGTLTTDGSSPKHNNRVIVGGNSVRIRRLTPRECWRLQGFPDEYFDKAKAAGISDTQLYKQAGNGVTVNVSRAIGERLKEVEEHGC